MVADKANFSASVGSIDGPYTLAGGADINGSPLKLDLAVGSKGSNGRDTDLTLQAGGGKLTFKGTLSELGPAAKVAGVASVATDSLTGFVGTLIKLTGQPEPALPPLLAGQVRFRWRHRGLADGLRRQGLQDDLGPGQRLGFASRLF